MKFSARRARRKWPYSGLACGKRLMVTAAAVLLMLFGLIFRGIAFEFRQRTEHMRWLWDWGFSIGSTVVAFVQGAAVGAMMRGIPVTNGHFAGHTFDWIHPFPILTGVGLVLGYALLGAGWIVFTAPSPQANPGLGSTLPVAGQTRVSCRSRTAPVGV